MNYPSIRIEGAILSADIIDRLDDMAGQKPVDFGLDSNTKVKDEIARAWADAQDYWRIFQRKLDSLKPDSPATTETRNLWIVPLLGLLRYDLEFQKAGAELNGKIYAISHRAINRAQTPVHIVGYRDPAGLDRKPTNATLRMSAHAVVQEYLNLTDVLYGVATNGRVIRLLRDSSRLINLSYVEFDLDRIFTDGLFADFAILYRVLHASRLPSDPTNQADSIIERLHQDSLDAGARIREGLSKAVEDAILTFANGFLSHPENGDLRERIADGRFRSEEFYECLLRLIYRLLFLMVIEERRLVFPESASLQQRLTYDRYYSVQRLRNLAEKRFLADRRKSDLWLSLLSTFRLFEAHSPGIKMGIYPLDGDLFNSTAIGPLATAQLSNEVLLVCLRSLSLYENPRNKQIIRVNYGALNVEEFGSVYEGLLEYEAGIDTSERVPSFQFRVGEDRSATGSHYTPDELVQPLIQHSLDYLIAACLKQSNPEKALLDLRVIDVSCGSGHILLAAARRIATELAIVRTGEEQPSPTAFRQALRDVIRHCIYGVDLNPLAVELCKVALWLEAHVPGEPLNFLDSHIKCGNSIVGYLRKEEVDVGVPDEAFAKLPGEDPDVGRRIRAQNKRERQDRQAGTRQLTFTDSRERQFNAVFNQAQVIAAMPERTPDEIEAKKRAHQKISVTGPIHDLRELASIPIAQFYVPRTEDSLDHFVTDADFHNYWSGHRFPAGQAVATAAAIAHKKRFFHWFIEFPDIIARGGFDCVLGNPPYLGGQALSGTYGHEFCNYVKHAYAPTGLSDLVVFFLRRIFKLLRKGGFTAFITTNSIKDGDVRKDGLEQVLAEGGSINFAVRGMKWPGLAKLVVSQVAIHRGPWASSCYLDGVEARTINAFFDDVVTSSGPADLTENGERVFQGSIFLGDGFLLRHEEADMLRELDPKNAEVLCKLINGQEMNTEPDQEPGRSIINFRNLDISIASTYEQPFAIVERLVKPEREKQKRDARKKRWWQFAERAAGLYMRIADKSRCFAAAATTKYLNFSAASTHCVFANTIYVFTTDRWDLYSIVQSTIHEVWARKYSGALETRLRYSPSDCFETFAFPRDLWNVPSPKLASIGERYHEHRRQLMRHMWLGLTDIYNLFHAPKLDESLKNHFASRAKKDPHGLTIPDEHRLAALSFSFDEALTGIQQLRELHVELDRTVLSAYGWHVDSLESSERTFPAVDLAHNFYDVETLPENDRTRFTISPGTRRELLARLLSLNHQRAAEEAASVAATPKTKGRSKAKAEKPTPLLDGLSQSPLRELTPDEKTILTIIASFPRINFEGVEELAGLFDSPKLRSAILHGSEPPKRRRVVVGVDAVYGRLLKENLIEQLPSGDIARLMLGSAIATEFPIDAKARKAIEEIKQILNARLEREEVSSKAEPMVRREENGEFYISKGAFNLAAT
jgi:hypothetical protein